MKRVSKYFSVKEILDPMNVSIVIIKLNPC